MPRLRIGGGEGVRRSRAWVTAVLALGVWQAGAGAAVASCLPGPLDSSWIARFAVEPGARMSPAELQALARSGSFLGYPVTLWPSRGPAPLQVGVLWWGLFRPDDLRAVAIDADGDGTPEVVDDREENLGYTYRQPGHFAATLTVRLGDGTVTTYQRPVTVLSPEAFDAELQARWTELKAALGRRDLEAALECVSHARRNRLRGVVTDLLGADVEQELPPIRFVAFHVTEARYESTRPPSKLTGPPEVRFRIDQDGVWRIAHLGPRGSE
jgi:hypothetical protein